MIPSHTTRSFWRLFESLPLEIRQDALAAYRLFMSNPAYPGLEFKKLKGTANIYSVRIGAHYRALGRMVDSGIVWYWIGSHADYDRLT